MAHRGSPKLAEAEGCYFPILFGFSLLWVSGWIVASVLYRRSRGKPIMFLGVPGALFVETTASGRSNRSWFTKLGGASRCLVVADVTVYLRNPGEFARALGKRSG